MMYHQFQIDWLNQILQIVLDGILDGMPRWHALMACTRWHALDGMPPCHASDGMPPMAGSRARSMACTIVRATACLDGMLKGLS